MNRGIIPQKPVTIITDSGDEAAIESVKQTAEQGLSTAQNAQAMARNQRNDITTLQGLATDYQQQLSASIADRNALHATTDANTAAITALNNRVDNIQLTPGPAGADGKPGRDGTPGKDGNNGSNGVDGKSAYDIARDLGYGGTKTQWLASLKGDQGATGQTGQQGNPGTPGKDANVEIRYRDGINVPAVSILNLGTAQVEVPVTWDTPFTGTDYIVTPQLATNTAALIGKVNACLKAGSKTTTGCVITVTTNAILTLGALVLSATAIRKT